MTTRPIKLACVLLGVGLLTACGQSPATNSNAAAGADGSLDPGILQDPAGYQPTKAPGLETPFSAGPTMGGPSASLRGPSGAAGGDINTEARVVVNDLIGLITDGEAELAIKLFNPDQVAALEGAPLDTLLNTFDVIDRLGRSLTEKLDREKAAGLLRELRGIGAAAPEIDVLDADHAAVKPNVARILFGKVKSARNLALARQDGRWRFQLDAPLTAEDVGNIVVYLDSLQVTLNQITGWLETSTQVNEDQLRELFKQALDGEPIDLGEIKGPGPAEPDQDQTGGGRVRPRGGRVRPAGPG